MPEILVTNDSTTVKVPKRSDILGVERKDWNRIKKLIRELSLKSSFWESAAWFVWGLTASSFLSYFSVDHTNTYQGVFLNITISSAIIGFLLIAVNKSLNKNSKRAKENILEEMTNMEVPEETNLPSQNQ